MKGGNYGSAMHWIRPRVKTSTLAECDGFTRGSFTNHRNDRNDRDRPQLVAASAVDAASIKVQQAGASLGRSSLLATLPASHSPRFSHILTHQRTSLVD